MNPTDIDDAMLIDHYYEADPEVERALERSSALRARFETLRNDLDRFALRTPEPSPDFGNRMWERVRPHLADSRPQRAWWSRLPVVSFATAAGLVAIAFFLGMQVGSDVEPTSQPTMVRVDSEKLLHRRLAEHLQETEQLLTLAAHNGESAGLETQWVQAVLASNRLYRQAALRAGDIRLARVLEELEPILIQLSNQPETAQPGDPSLMFRIRVLNKEMTNEII